MNLEPRRNKYVGHRYVPKIFGEWKRENSYEGLSIVTFEGASYTSKKHVPAGIDIKNEDYWVLTGNYNAQIEYYRKEVQGYSQRIDDGIKEIKAISLKNTLNVNTMKELDLKSGDMIITTGYYDLFDGGNNLYIITETGTVNDIDIIQIKNGLKAVLYKEGGISPIDFGITGKESEEDSIKRWDRYLSYVNTNDKTFFYINKAIKGRYEVYKPLLFRKSVIGEKSTITPEITYMNSKTTNKIVSSTETSKITNMPLSVKAVACLVTENNGSKYEVSNLTINCTDLTVNNDAMDYGLYIPETTRIHVHDIRVNYPKRIGFMLGSTWVSTIERIEVFNAGFRGVQVGYFDVEGGISKTGTSTSLTMSSCFVNGAVDRAYKIYGCQYTSLSNMACDNVKNAKAIYDIELCKGVVLNSLAMEKSSANTLIVINGCGSVVINTPYFLDVGIRNSIISIDNYVERYNGAITINNPAFMGGVYAIGDTKPIGSYSFNTSQLVTFNGESMIVKLSDDSTINVVFGNLQKNFFEFTSDNQRRLVDGTWQYFTLSNSKKTSDLKSVDVSNLFTSSSSKVTNIKAHQTGEIITFSANVNVVSGWNNLISTTLRPKMNIVLNCHNSSGDKMNNNVSGAISPDGNISILSETDSSVIVSGQYLV